MFTVFTFIVVLSILVFVHELGHFAVARKCGLKPAEFGFGFSPRVFAAYKNQEGKWVKVFGNKEITDASDTIYSINLFPIGGFVKLGEDDEAVNDDEPHFNNRPIWQRASILLAGVTMNFLLAFVLISFGFMLGLPQVLDDIDPNANISERKIQVASVMKDSPAEASGLELGDVILEIDGNKFTAYAELQDYVDKGRGKELTYSLKRAGEIVEAKIVPGDMADTDKAGIGVGIVETGTVRYSFFKSIWHGAQSTVMLTWAIIVAFGGLLSSIFTGNGVGAEVSGPVGIATLTGQVARMGFVYLLQFTAMLSINLAIINAFPFPALDGGRLVFLFVEKIKGSPVKKEVEGTIHGIGFMLLMILIAVVTFKDIASYSYVFKSLWEKVAG